jgi:hypothetical protein
VRITGGAAEDPISEVAALSNPPLLDPDTRKQNGIPPLLTAILDITFKNDCHNVGAIY